MEKLKELFKDNTKTIADLTPEQAIIIAQIVFNQEKTVKWEITRQEKDGYWLNGMNTRLGIKYYCHISDYFEIFSSAHFAPHGEEKEWKSFDHNIGSVNVGWEDGVPYINLMGWFLENGFNVFARYPKQKQVGLEIKS